VINSTPFVEFINKHGLGGKNEGHYCSIINTNQTIIKPCLNKKKIDGSTCLQTSEAGRWAQIVVGVNKHLIH
jgi:hypothetical protein